ncbi:hypothetical protein SAMN05216244_1346 [Sediminibacillus halophilus]|uniref:Uncharacterized protein n=1 Tax=Sediminibacillus halophilus TaxID=482461 RepID=A0A1G9P9Y1_9BACI|nr:hypothetical protein SAMN05216244_1346 [Sediminibacillus halophilus]
MWQIMVERLPDKLGILCMLLAFFVPYLINKVNRQLHKHGDPPWKKKR